MSHFLLPSIPYNNNLTDAICSTYCDIDMEEISINKTLCKYLNNVKAEIDSRQIEWDKYKKYTNPYEFIHSIIPNSKQSVCRLKPLSRSFYKMVEICNLLFLLDYLPDKCSTFHLAEGPGGFIEAIQSMRTNRDDLYYGMTLIDDSDQSIPGWKKSKAFLTKNPNVIIEKGIDGTGDLMSADNLRDCFTRYNGSMDLITADGGFDFSVDFNHQEKVSGKLVFCQIAFAIAMQKKNGNFIIKFFDTFTQMSLDLLFILSNVYDQVYFVKPNTSRYANSEKYIVCKGFRLENSEELVKRLHSVFKTFPVEGNMKRILSIDIPYIFTSRVEEYNAIFGQQQIESITSTLNLIDNNKYDRLDTMKKTNIQKCVNWCQKYKLPYNKVITSNNIFLVGRNQSSDD
jgi:23S rRNA U2552 (ribose-2'-O)-methylase RlmE/FtsJ